MRSWPSWRPSAGVRSRTGSWRGPGRALISGHLSTLDDQGRLEEFWLGQAAAGLDTGVEELAERFASITREQVAAAAQRLELDTVYFLKGQED